MKKIRLYQWLGLGLVGVATGCGSTRGERYAEAPPTPRGVALVYSGSSTACQSCRTYQPKPMASVQVHQPAQPVMQASYQGSPAQVVPATHQVDETMRESGVITADHVVTEGSDREPPIIQTVAEAVPVNAPQSKPVLVPIEAVNAKQSQWAPVVQHVVAPRGNNLHGESIPNRRAVHDITASPCFAKAEDYSWLQGQVEYSRLSKSWRLRYASVDEVDKFGGSVTLTGDTLLDSLKDGQYVRIRGYLPNPETRGMAPAYRVEAIDEIDMPK
jgi:hypothetical protein